MTRSRQTHSVSRRRIWRGDAASGVEEVQDEDAVAVEEPLEISVAGVPLTLTMRTPGDDVHLAIGFLLAEGIVERASDLGRVISGPSPGRGRHGHCVDVCPADGLAFDASRIVRTARGTMTTASCGVCGRRTIQDLVARIGRLPAGPTISSAVVSGAPERLRARQGGFASTGGMHGAAVLAADGEVLAAAEDVGRHNAVDKVVGALLVRGLLDELPPARRPVILVVSGRISFEMAQKAAAARIPVVAGVSAPTSMAIDLAERARITLVAFVRDANFNVYTHPDRISGEGAG